MTYPPQQQPDPWGQQQGPQDTWVQQPDQQWGQQPPPPQDPWGGGGGYDGYGPPPKKGGGKTLAIVLVIVVVLAGAGVGLFFWLKNKNGNDNAGPGGMNPDDPKSVATAWADMYSRAYNSDYQEVKASDLKPLMCASQAKELDQLQQDADAKRARQSSGSAMPTSSHRKYKLTVGDVKANGDAATVMITAIPEGASAGGGSSAPNAQAQSKAFEMKKENGGWKVCGPQSDSGGGGGSGAPAPSGGSIPSLPGGGSGGGGPATSGGGGLPSLPSGMPLPTR
jgi:ketosteroid isomerase-like protein